MKITFDESKHAYWIDGKRVPSVTQILAVAGLIDTSHYSENACIRGTAVHAAIHFINDKDLDFDSLDSIVRPYVEAFRRFTRDVKFRLYHSELRVGSARFGFAGTLDLYGKVNRRTAIIDIKTGAVPAWAGLQTAGYMIAAMECRLRPQARFALRLTAEGDYKLTECADGADFFSFHRARELAQEKANDISTCSA